LLQPRISSGKIAPGWQVGAQFVRRGTIAALYERRAKATHKNYRFKWGCLGDIV
jgi:hypothetical protein